MNRKVGRAVLCAPTAATTLSHSAKNGAHGVTRPTSANRFTALMRNQNTVAATHENPGHAQARVMLNNFLNQIQPSIEHRQI